MTTFLRIKLVPYVGTDLMCAACGRFGAELGIDTAMHDTPLVGVHKKCRGLLHTKRERREGSAPKSVKLNDLSTMYGKMNRPPTDLLETMPANIRESLDAGHVVSITTDTERTDALATKGTS